MSDDEKKPLKRPRPTTTMEHQSNQARAASSRPNKKVHKPTLVEIAAVKYAKGSMNQSTKHVKYKGLRKTLEENEERIVDAAMKTAGECKCDILSSQCVESYCIVGLVRAHAGIDVFE